MNRRILMITVAALIVLGALFAVFWGNSPDPKAYEFEIAKAILQIVVVVVFGSIASNVLTGYQEERKKLALAVVEREHRGRERADYLRTLLEGLLEAYHGVKRARRLLFAEIGATAGGRVSLIVYDSYLRSLTDDQLQFETYKRMAKVLDPEPRIADEFENRCKDIEHYLNEIIDEYKNNRYRVAASRDGLALDELERLKSFIEPRGDFGMVSTPFEYLINELRLQIVVGRTPTSATIASTATKMAGT
jgi:hypothetical protein